MSPASRPTYRGRPLPRPDDELVDQGLSFDLGTLLSRRQALRGLGTVAAAVGLTACAGGAESTSSSSSTAATPAVSQEIPDETAGPYPGDGSNGPDVLAESGVVRSDITTSSGDATGTAEGVPMTLDLVVRDLAAGGTPFAGVTVYVWQCDREGRYSLYSDGVTDQNYLRGVQIVDARGRVTFRSVFPPATRAGGRTSTSRSTRTRRASPTALRRSPRRRWRCRRTPARRCTPNPATRTPCAPSRR